MTLQQTRIRLWLVRMIMVLMPWNFAMPIMVPFWHSIGLNQFQIGLSQAAFTVVMVLCSIKAGELADYYGRRPASIFGLGVATVGFLAYAATSNFIGVVACELLIGLGLAFASGADTGLHRVYCERLGVNLGRDRIAINTVAQFIAAIAMFYGGILGASHPRLVMGLTALQYGAAALLALGLDEVLEPRERTPLLEIVRDIHADRRLRWRIIATALAREVTHASIWIFTPLMLAVGVAPAIVGAGWAVQALCMVAGGFVARWAHDRGIPAPHAFAGGMAVTLATSAVLAVWQNPVTVIGAFAVFGVMRSWTGNLVSPLITQAAHPHHVTTTESVADTISRLLYAPLVTLSGWVSGIALPYTMALTVAVFAVPAIVTTINLHREE